MNLSVTEMHTLSPALPKGNPPLPPFSKGGDYIHTFSCFGKDHVLSLFGKGHPLLLPLCERGVSLSY